MSSTQIHKIKAFYLHCQQLQTNIYNKFVWHKDEEPNKTNKNIKMKTGQETKKL